MFQYLMKLHYSQTLSIFHNKKVGVSVPYEITLLSNLVLAVIDLILVSVPYEITLLSNPSNGMQLIKRFQYLMKLHYSQTTCSAKNNSTQFQYLMKLHYSQTPI